MGRSKDLFMKMMEEFFGDNEWFSKPDDIKKGASKETFEVNKNGVKTTITVWFDKKGYVVGQSSESHYIPTEDEERTNKLQLLEKQKEAALEAQDYELAAQLRDQIKQLKPLKTN